MLIHLSNIEFFGRIRERRESNWDGWVQSANASSVPCCPPRKRRFKRRHIFIGLDLMPCALMPYRAFSTITKESPVSSGQMTKLSHLKAAFHGSWGTSNQQNVIIEALSTDYRWVLEPYKPLDSSSLHLSDKIVELKKFPTKTSQKFTAQGIIC